MKKNLLILCLLIIAVCFMNLGSLVADQKKQSTDKVVHTRSNYVTSSKIWRCPKCKNILKKKWLGKVVYNSCQAKNHVYIIYFSWGGYVNSFILGTLKTTLPLS